MKKNKIIFVLFVFLISCFQTRYTVNNDLKNINIKKIAVVNFKNLTDYVNAGKIVSKVIRTEFYVNKLNCLPEYKMDKIINEKIIDLEKYLAANKYIELGKLLNVQYLIIGDVAEYRYKHGLGDDPAIGINTRMIDCLTGKIVWASSYSKSGGAFFLFDRSLSELNQIICKKIVADFIKSLKK